MQLFQPLFVFLSLLSVSSACLILDGFMSQDYIEFRGTLNDNGIEVCKWNYAPLTSPSRFATCLPGFSAYITKDAEIVGYSNKGYEVRFRSVVRSIPPAYPGLPINYSVTAKNYNC